MEPFDSQTPMSDQGAQLDEEVRTPLTDTILCLKEQALESNLLCIMDVEELMKLATLNQLRQRANRLPEYDPAQRTIGQRFGPLYIWLHEINNCPIHKDEKTGLWRLGVYLWRKGRKL
ncbi:hypothetical protein KSF_082660 [Reticulibacter mediterranei]|uniref:Uncharacterized protein n=1 Tax=Reticulibacter mediterranei TaxID=2778369 RepID=A0A8J3ITC2_9CHLR|nr:hypothetical protein [Reticulibacter mediterranei]GHO98218.1 hypothetical protein KSF_082660 [Reticulibacter mediterranei]